MAIVQFFDALGATQALDLGGESGMLPLAALGGSHPNTSSTFQDYCSRIRTGNCSHHTPPEKLRGSPKEGRLHGIRSFTRQATVRGVVNWQTYNNRRLNSIWAYVSGVESTGHGPGRKGTPPDKVSDKGSENDGKALGELWCRVWQKGG